MATFIAYQPQASEPSFGNHIFGKSSTVGLCSRVSSRRSSKSSQQAQSVSDADFADFVDPTTSDQVATREYLVVREILEPTAHDPDKREIQVARTRSSGVIDSVRVEDGEECDKDDDIDYESDISDLPSLTDIFRRSDSGFEGNADLNCKASASPAPVDRSDKECCHQGDWENSGNPIATTVAGIQLGANQDNPIVLDNDQPVDIPDAAASDDQTPTLEVTDPTPPCGPTLSGRFVEPDTEDGKDTPDSLARYNVHDPLGDEKGGSNKSHKDDAFNIRTLTRGNGNGSGIGSDAPASVGQIHDVFAEFEKTFGMARRKQQTVVASLRDCPHRDVTAGSIPRPVSQGEPRSAADDGAAGIEQLARAVSSDVGHSYLSTEDIENVPTFQSRQESDGQETQTEDVRSQCISALASDCHLESASAFTEPLPSPPPMVTHEATRPNPDTDTQGVPNRKRTRPPTQPTTLSDDGVPRKRPRRATKETWKAREAREAREKFEAKPSQTPLNPYRKKQTPFVGRDSGWGKMVGKVADIEDVYLGEDGSVQCLVTWKPSLIAMENLVGEGLRRRCEELFGKRYGHQEV